MARTSSMAEFREALAGLVSTTGRARRNAHPFRRVARARSNMAIEYDGIRFDTVEELLEYKRAMGSGGGARTPSTRHAVTKTPQAPPPPPRQTRAPRAPARASASSPILELLESVPKSYVPRIRWGYKYASDILGGTGSYAPKLRSAAHSARTTLDGQTALRILGMEEDMLPVFMELVQEAHPEVFEMATSKAGESYWKLVPSNISPEVTASAKDIALGMGVQLEG